MSGDETNAQAQYAGRLSDYLSLGVIARIYRRDVVDQVLLETRSKEKRQRLLPARLVVYYVIALALFPHPLWFTVATFLTFVPGALVGSALSRV